MRLLSVLGSSHTDAPHEIERIEFERNKQALLHLAPFRQRCEAFLQPDA